MKRICKWLILSGVLLFLAACQSGADVQSPWDQPNINGTWPAWKTVLAAGWSESELQEVREKWTALNSAALVVVYRGKVLLAWGEYGRNYHTHSMRKSFMSALIGVYSDRGGFDLYTTLAELGIDDEPPLTEVEKTARVHHLLEARSGIYHTAAAETDQMHQYKPARGSHAPGTYWCYNNWDFNALATIFDLRVPTGFFQALYTDLFEKLGVEDYQPGSQNYSYQLGRSIHPAYGFRISARDAARFGQLFLNRGVWNGQRILSESWIDRSTSDISFSGDYIPGTRYGYMWWIYPEGYGLDHGLTHLAAHRSYAALGAYGQVIRVIPDEEMVFVHRSDSDRGINVPLEAVDELLNDILAARLSP